MTLKFKFISGLMLGSMAVLGGCISGDPSAAIAKKRPSADVLNKCRKAGDFWAAKARAAPVIVLGPMSAISAITREQRFRDRATEKCINNNGEFPRDLL